MTKRQPPKKKKKRKTHTKVAKKPHKPGD